MGFWHIFYSELRKMAKKTEFLAFFGRKAVSLALLWTSNQSRKLQGFIWGTVCYCELTGSVPNVAWNVHFWARFCPVWKRTKKSHVYPKAKVEMECVHPGRCASWPKLTTFGQHDQFKGCFVSVRWPKVPKLGFKSCFLLACQAKSPTNSLGHSRPGSSL